MFTSRKAQIAKEFVKFNERCLIGLLGDMRSLTIIGDSCMILTKWCIEFVRLILTNSAMKEISKFICLNISKKIKMVEMVL